MSHITGIVQVLGAPAAIGPDTGAPPTSPGVWELAFAHTPAPGGTKLVMLHFQNVSLPGSNRLEVDLGYDTDVFTAADGAAFWTRPVNVNAFGGGTIPVRYVEVGGAGGSAEIDRYGRGERHDGGPGHPSFSNSDPFLPDPVYTEPTYDPFWFCSPPPNWENVRCIPAADLRAQVARSVGMIVSIHPPDTYSPVEYVSTCTVTLVDADKVISAGHCHAPAEALTSSVTFDYETDCAGNRLAGYNAMFHKVAAALQQRYDSGYDYSLLQLKTAPPGIAPIQLRHDLPDVGEQVFGIHHPNGAVKKISLPHASFATVTARNAMGVRVPTTFHVSGGSSGSGLFDAAGRIVGVLSNGAPCAGSQLLYFPTATILTEIAPAPPPPVTRDVVLVIDRSGSMDEPDGTGRRKIDAAKDAVSLFVQLVQADTGNRVGLVSFSSTAGAPTFAIAAVTGANKNTLIGGPPYAGGVVGSLTPGGATSIGGGLDAARGQFPMPGANPRAILLLTDGLQNRAPSIESVEPALEGIAVHAIGLGSDSNLDSMLLSTLAGAHGGLYTRASGGLALLKFFSQAFGNIFEAGVLLDPERDLPANQDAPPLSLRVCGEERLTAVVGWDRMDASLLVRLRTPAGNVVPMGAPGVESSMGRNWVYLRVPLPQGAERDGVWQVEVLRPGGSEFPPPAPALRYFVSVIPAGGPRLLREPEEYERNRAYTGDDLSPLLRLRQANGDWPHHVAMTLTVSRPDAGIGNLLSEHGLGPEQVVNGDVLPARQATLQAIEANGPAIRYIDEQFILKEDAANTRGAFEAAGSLGIALPDYLRMEGNYTFHARATYGECDGMRELVWTMHVDVGIDGGRTLVSTEPLGADADGRDCLRLTFTPRDRYGNRFGPGRAADMTVAPRTGTVLTSPVTDLGNGSYRVDLCWDLAAGEPPGITIGQPGRPPVVVGPAERRLYVYSVTFVCGEQRDNCCGCTPVRPGSYGTEINIHNVGNTAAPVLKRIIPLVFAGAVIGREPQVATVKTAAVITLPPHAATMDDCCRLQEMLLGAAVDTVALTTGVLEIISTVELAVTAVYTREDGAIDVRAIAPRRL
ncbi:vWA domain-containing protein [[Empedobacter] haloabium]|uniref:VWA domain-containing protein n=1 Tax=[Empedobacter] haloabium TaxID=592317 RepID=A0ABZ1UGP3_9BURK